MTEEKHIDFPELPPLPTGSSARITSDLPKIVENVEKAPALLEKPIDSRRRDLLYFLSVGIPFSDAIKMVSAKYKVTDKAVYKDFKNREKWASQFMEVGDAQLVEIQTFLEFVKRHAIAEYYQGDNSSAKVGALRAAQEAVMNIYQIAKDTGKVQTIPEKLDLTLREEKELDVEGLDDAELEAYRNVARSIEARAKRLSPANGQS